MEQQVDRLIRLSSDLLFMARLDQDMVADTLNLVLKTEQDVTLARELLPAWLRQFGKR